MLPFNQLFARKQAVPQYINFSLQNNRFSTYQLTYMLFASCILCKKLKPSCWIQFITLFIPTRSMIRLHRYHKFCLSITLLQLDFD